MIDTEQVIKTITTLKTQISALMHAQLKHLAETRQEVSSKIDENALLRGTYTGLFTSTTHLEEEIVTYSQFVIRYLEDIQHKLSKLSENVIHLCSNIKEVVNEQ